MSVPAMLSALTVLLSAVLAAAEPAAVPPMSASAFFASLPTSEAAKAARAATTPVPRKLRDLFVGSNTLVPKHIALTVAQAAAMAAAGGKPPTQTSAHRPSWTALADSSPKRTPPFTRPKLTHRGQEVTPDFIVGADDRRTYVDTRYPYGTVAKVLISGGGSCSGVLIGPRHVLTASHCVNWGKPYPTSVEINRRGTALSSSASVTNIISYFQVSNYKFSDVDGDFAVLVLSSRLGDVHGWMGTRTYTSAWDNLNVWANIGYPGDIASATYPIYQSPFSMRVVDSDGDAGLSIQSQMDQIAGQSGGPSYAYFERTPYVVAVCSGTSTPPPTNWQGGGDRLVNLVASARNSYP